MRFSASTREKEYLLLAYLFPISFPAMIMCGLTGIIPLLLMLSIHTPAMDVMPMMLSMRRSATPSLSNGRVEST
jgi:hypothetical protein